MLSFGWRKKHHSPKLVCEVQYGWFVKSTLQSNTAHINIAQQCDTRSKPAQHNLHTAHSNTATPARSNTAHAHCNIAYATSRTAIRMQGTQHRAQQYGCKES
jgi:hypothetical protein